MFHTCAICISGRSFLTPLSIKKTRDCNLIKYSSVININALNAGNNYRQATVRVYMCVCNFFLFFFVERNDAWYNHATPRAELHAKHSFSLVCQALHTSVWVNEELYDASFITYFLRERAAGYCERNQEHSIRRGHRRADQRRLSDRSS